MVLSKNTIPKKEIKIRLHSLPESPVRNILINAYRLGYDKVILKFKEQVSSEIIEAMIYNLIGFGLIKKEKKVIILESIAYPSEYRANRIFSKLLRCVDSLFEILENGKSGDKKDFEIIEEQIQAFNNLCRRVVSRSNKPHMQLRWAFQTELGHAQKEIYLTLKEIQKLQNRSKELKRLTMGCKNLYILLKKAYTERDVHLLWQIHKLQERLIEEQGYNLLKTCNPKERIAVYHLLNAIRNLSIATSPLIGLFMNRKVK